MEIGKLLTSKITLSFLVVVLLMICILLGYAISRDAEISLSKNRWLKISPKGNERIKELQQKLANSVSIDKYNEVADKYKRLKEEHQNVSDKLAKIEKIVSTTKGNREGVVSKVALLWARTRDIESDVKYSLSVIRSELSRNGTINTRRPATVQRRRDLYMHVQRFFSSIGEYNGEITGDQLATYNAVIEFQARNNLVVDGIIGKKTMAAMETKYEQEKMD